MDDRPRQTPEGKLISDAAAAAGISGPEASRRAAISYGRWRQITSGVQHISPGVTAPVRAPAATLARMARAVGVSPEQLASEGKREDAAEILRKLIRHAADAALPADAAPGRLRPADDIPAPEDDQAHPGLSPAARAVAREVEAAERAWRAAGNPGSPDAVVIFGFAPGSSTDPGVDALLWQSPGLTREARFNLIAEVRAAFERARNELTRDTSRHIVLPPHVSAVISAVPGKPGANAARPTGG